jgi:hypothetical protein
MICCSAGVIGTRFADADGWLPVAGAANGGEQAETPIAAIRVIARSLVAMCCVPICVSPLPISRC